MMEKACLSFFSFFLYLSLVSAYLRTSSLVPKSTSGAIAAVLHSLPSSHLIIIGLGSFIKFHTLMGKVNNFGQIRTFVVLLFRPKSIEKNNGHV